MIVQTPGVGCLLASWHMARPESGAAEQQGSSVPFWLGGLKLQDSLERWIRVTAAVCGCNRSLYIIKSCDIKPDHLVMLCGSWRSSRLGFQLSWCPLPRASPCLSGRELLPSRSSSQMAAVMSGSPACVR